MGFSPQKVLDGFPGPLEQLRFPCLSKHRQSFPEIAFRKVFELTQLFVRIKDDKFSFVSPFCPSQIRTTTQSPQEHQQLIVKALNQVACGKSCINLKRQRNSKQKCCCVSCYCAFFSCSMLSYLENHSILCFYFIQQYYSTIFCIEDFSVVFFPQERKGKQFPPYITVFICLLMGPF